MNHCVKCLFVPHSNIALATLVENFHFWAKKYILHALGIPYNYLKDLVKLFVDCMEENQTAN